MRNIFKPHSSRFSILNEDVELNNQNYKNNNNNINNNNKNKNQNFNTDNDSKKRYSNFTSTNRRTTYQEHSKKITAKIPPTISDKILFPELIKNTTNTASVLEEKPKQSFLEKLKTVKDEPPIENTEEVIKDGCVSITFQNRKTTYKYGKMSYIPDDIKKINPEYVMSSLVDIHEKRKEYHINLWGYDDYEKIFLSPNYDYEYFDKLDEQYELEMENLELEETQLEPEETYY